MRFFIGFLFFAVGALIIWKAAKLEEWVGDITWAEQHLGTEGGTKLFLQLFGIFTILLGFFVASNTFVKFVQWILPLQNLQ